MARNYVIKNGTRADANEIAALINRSVGSCVTPAFCSALCHSHLAHTLVVKRLPSFVDRLAGVPERTVAVMSMQLVPGYQLGKTSPETFEKFWFSRIALISYLAVDEQERRRGWSRPLIERAVRWAFVQHASHVAAVAWTPAIGVQSRDMLLRANFQELAALPMRKLQPQRLCNVCLGTCNCQGVVLVRELNPAAWSEYQRQHPTGKR